MELGARGLEPYQFSVWWVQCFASVVNQSFHQGVKECRVGLIVLLLFSGEYHLFLPLHNPDDQQCECCFEEEVVLAIQGIQLSAFNDVT